MICFGHHPQAGNTWGLWMFFPCGHGKCCAVCGLKMRFLLDNNKCNTCMKEWDHCILTEKTEAQLVESGGWDGFKIHVPPPGSSSVKNEEDYFSLRSDVLWVSELGCFAEYSATHRQWAVDAVEDMKRLVSFNYCPIKGCKCYMIPTGGGGGGSSSSSSSHARALVAAGVGGGGSKEASSSSFPALGSAPAESAGRSAASASARANLIHHMKTRHSEERLCTVCLEKAAEFPRFMEVFPTKFALDQHCRKRHEFCIFCGPPENTFMSDNPADCMKGSAKGGKGKKGKAKGSAKGGSSSPDGGGCYRGPFGGEWFYSKPECGRHMNQRHEKCWVCEKEKEGSASGGTPAGIWFPTYDELYEHFRVAHYACEEPSCWVAERKFQNIFGSYQDLKDHYRLLHSGKSLPASQLAGGFDASCALGGSALGSSSRKKKATTAGGSASSSARGAMGGGLAGGPPPLAGLVLMGHEDSEEAFPSLGGLCLGSGPSSSSASATGGRPPPPQPKRPPGQEEFPTLGAARPKVVERYLNE